MRNSLTYSLVLHFIIGVLLVINLPNFKHNNESEIVVTVDIVKISQETNLKGISKSNKNSSKIKKKKKTSKTKQKTKSIKTLKTKNITNEKKESLSTKDSLETLLKDLEGKKGTKSQNTTDTKEKHNYSTKTHDANLPLSISQKDNIKTQIERKFVNPIALDFKPQELVIKLRLIMNIDGTIKDTIVLNSSIYSRSHADTFLTLKNGLIRAAHRASPIEGLPKEKYYGPEGWQEIELTFDAYNLMNVG
ncbi:MAG: hypothetical protein K0T99_04645 [Alphaproteobacteria bacterium]|nr:hypothetical protein [Alphaproteobacteria bacterium]